MKSVVPRLQLIAVVVFLAVCVGLLFVHGPPTPGAATDPKSRCEARGDWWDDEDKVCAVPTPLSTITGQTPTKR